MKFTSREFFSKKKYFDLVKIRDEVDPEKI